jgi:hypothetical protein
VSYPTKIATCCFCGSRAALTLGEGRHELACASCGAPLHDLKRLPVEAAGAAPALRQFTQHAPRGGKPKPVRAKKSARKPKKRKSWLRWAAKEAFDALEDVLD